MYMVSALSDAKIDEDVYENTSVDKLFELISNSDHHMKMINSKDITTVVNEFLIINDIVFSGLNVDDIVDSESVRGYLNSHQYFVLQITDKKGKSITNSIVSVPKKSIN